MNELINEQHKNHIPKAGKDRQMNRLSSKLLKQASRKTEYKKSYMYVDKHCLRYLN